MTRVRKEKKGVLDVCGGWVDEDMEGEGEMKAWMGMVGWKSIEAGKAIVEEEAVGAVGGLLKDMEGVMRAETYHVQLN